MNSLVATPHYCTLLSYRNTHCLLDWHWQWCPSVELICEFTVYQNVYKGLSEAQGGTRLEMGGIRFCYFFSFSEFLCLWHTKWHFLYTSLHCIFSFFFASRMKGRERMVSHLVAHTALFFHKALLQSYLLSPVKGALTLHRHQAFY